MCAFFLLAKHRGKNDCRISVMEMSDDRLQGLFFFKEYLTVMIETQQRDQNSSQD